MTNTIRDYDALRRALAAHREALGLTHDDLAAAAGLPPFKVRNVERGYHCLDDSTLGPWLRALGLELHFVARAEGRSAA